MISKFETVGYIEVPEGPWVSAGAFSSYNSGYESLLISLQMNGLNERRRQITYLRKMPSESYLFKNFPQINKFLNGDGYSIDAYWKKTPYKKQYWIDNYYATGLIYDPDFEHRYMLERLAKGTDNE